MPKAKISDLELKLWTDRLSHSEAVWREKGIMGDEPGLPGNESLQRILQYYRGAHWDFGLGIDGGEAIASLSGDRMTVNSIFQTANTIMAQVAARAPRVMLFPKSSQAVEQVRPASTLYNYYVGELDMKRQANAALFESLFSPFGIVRHGYTPMGDCYDKDGNRIHAYRDAKPDTPWIKHVHSWDFRADCTKGSFHPAEVDWCAFRSLMTVDQVEQTEGMRRPDKLSPTVSIQADQLRPDELKSLQDDDFTSLVEVWSIYDSLEEKWLQWSPGAPDTLLRDPADWPLEWDELPYEILGINQQTDDPFPRPYMAEVAPIHRERNRLRTMMSRLSRDLRRLVAYNEKGLGDNMQGRLLDGVGPDLLEFIACKGPPSETFYNLQIGGFPQELAMYDALLTEDIREITGQGKMDRAQRINVESAHEANFVQQGSDTQRGRNQAAFEDFWRGIIRKFGQGLRSVMDEEQIIPIVGIEDANTLATAQGAGGGEPFLTVTPDAIAQDYQFEIAVGSTLPRNQGEEQRKALAWLEVAAKYPENANIQDALIGVARSMDKDPATALIDEETRQGMRDMANQQGGEGGGDTPPTVSPLIAAMGGGGG